jgi:hypothetical protein
MFERSLPMALGAILFTATAGATDLTLEPCVNGDVSPSGTYPSAAMEREIQAYLTWKSYEPYYLFAVSASYLESPFGQETPETR